MSVKPFAKFFVSLLLVCLPAAALTSAAPNAGAQSVVCPEGFVLIDGKFCQLSYGVPTGESDPVAAHMPATREASTCPEGSLGVPGSCYLELCYNGHVPGWKGNPEGACLAADGTTIENLGEQTSCTRGTLQNGKCVQSVVDQQGRYICPEGWGLFERACLQCPAGYETKVETDHSDSGPVVACIHESTPEYGPIKSADGTYPFNPTNVKDCITKHGKRAPYYKDGKCYRSSQDRWDGRNANFNSCRYGDLPDTATNLCRKCTEPDCYDNTPTGPFPPVGDYAMESPACSHLLEGARPSYGQNPTCEVYKDKAASCPNGTQLVSEYTCSVAGSLCPEGYRFVDRGFHKACIAEGFTPITSEQDCALAKTAYSDAIWHRHSDKWTRVEADFCAGGTFGIANSSPAGGPVFTDDGIRASLIIAREDGTPENGSYIWSQTHAFRIYKRAEAGETTPAPQPTPGSVTPAPQPSPTVPSSPAPTPVAPGQRPNTQPTPVLYAQVPKYPGPFGSEVDSEPHSPYGFGDLYSPSGNIDGLGGGDADVDANHAAEENHAGGLSHAAGVTSGGSDTAGGATNLAYTGSNPTLAAVGLALLSAGAALVALRRRME